MYIRHFTCMAVFMLTPSWALAQLSPFTATTFTATTRLNPIETRDFRLRTLDPFFGEEFDERFPHFEDVAGHGRNDFNGTPESIDRFNPLPRDPFEGLEPDEIEARGEFFRDRGIGTGRRAYGVGTGSGNQAAGFGALNYGTRAGLGVMFSGMGDLYAGQGAYMRGAGDYEHANSLANINNEKAQYHDMKNEETYAETYFNKRRINLESRRSEYGLRQVLYTRPSREQIARLQKLREPDLLKTHQHDELAGLLYWPDALRAPEFRDERRALNNLYAERVDVGTSSGLGTENTRRIRAVAAAMMEQLQQQIDELSPMEYMLARKFIESVAREALDPPGMLAPVADLRMR